MIKGQESGGASNSPSLRHSSFVISHSGEAGLLSRAAAETRWPDWWGLDADVLGRIARTEGLDFATALLYDRLARSPEHGPAIRRLREPAAATAGMPPLAIVPGAFYREYPDTGADGRALLASLPAGQRVERVPVRSFGAVAENAETICRWLRARPAGEGLVVVALSKGAADAAAAMARPEADAAFGDGRVRAVVNVSGLLGGTALVDYLRVRPLAMAWVRTFLWWHGYRRETFDELARGHPALTIPERTPVPVVHVVGFPLARHLHTRRARRGYRRLAPLGPNDGGGILLGDVTRWPGTILPVWGADHYLAGVDVPGLLASVLPPLQRMSSPS